MSDPVDLDALRSAMGAALQDLVPTGLAAFEVPGAWVAVSAGSTPDSNLGLVYDDRADLLAQVSGALGGIPGLLMLAGAGRALADRVGPEWHAAGTMPMMTRDLTGANPDRDPRVRVASDLDAAAVITVGADAFAIPPADMALMVEPSLSPDTAMTTWLLAHDGEVVSCVMSCVLGPIVAIYSMATPAAHARRGFGGALLDTVLAAAIDDGAEIGVLGATPAGEPLYRAKGWHSVEDWQLFVNVDEPG